MLCLTLLPPGTIRDLFAPWRASAIRKGIERNQVSSFVPGQCVHTVQVYDEVSGATYTERCLEDAENLPPHGFLCKKHFNQTPAVAIEIDDGLTDYILGIEKKALSGVPRERVNRLTTIKGLRMKNDPAPYEPKEKKVV